MISPTCIVGRPGCLFVVAIVKANASVIAEYVCSVVGARRARRSARSARLRLRSAARCLSIVANLPVLLMPRVNCRAWQGTIAIRQKNQRPAPRTRPIVIQRVKDATLEPLIVRSTLPMAARPWAGLLKNLKCGAGSDLATGWARR